MWLKNIGPGRKEIGAAAYKEMTEGLSCSPGGTMTPTTVDLTAKLASIYPDKDARTWSLAAQRRSRSPSRWPRSTTSTTGEASRYKVISRKGSYHGAPQA